MPQRLSRCPGQTRLICYRRISAGADDKVLRPDRLPSGGVAEAVRSPRVTAASTTGPCLVSLSRTGTGRCFIEIRHDIPTLRGHRRRPPGSQPGLGSAGRGTRSRWLTRAALPRAAPGPRAGSAAPRAAALARCRRRSRPTSTSSAVPDAALPAVAAELARLWPRSACDRADVTARPCVAHTSGATSVEVLDAVRAGQAPPPWPSTRCRPSATLRPGATASRAPRSPSPPATAPPILTPPRMGFALARAARCPALPSGRRQAQPLPRGRHARLQLPRHPGASGDAALRRGRACPRDEALALFLPLVRATLDNVEPRAPSRR